ncbi:MAG: GNAT family N-acetyltransferase [Arachidicoccus sp.]|nr:GNAT family N-acetyltransferase [Arachidicoccus sp.]
MNNGKFTIKRIKEKDNKALAKLIRTTLEEYAILQCGTVYSDPTTDDLFALFQTPGSIFYVALMNNEVVGCCGIYPTEGLPNGCAELVKFYVGGNTRGLGIGKTLMLQSIEFAKQTGYQQLYLESFPNFTTAIAMYKKTGLKI